MGSVTLFGGPVVQFYQVQGVPPTTPVAIKAQGNSNYLMGPNQDNAWSITGPNAGTLDKGKAQGIFFSGIQNVIGGSGNDDFAFQPAATLSGHLDGGLGTDTLEFSSYAQAVALAITQHGTQDGVQGTAGLKSNNAPIIGSGFDNIDSLIGDTGAVLDGTKFTGNFDTRLQVTSFGPFLLNVPMSFTGSLVADTIGGVNVLKDFLGQIVVSKSFGALNAAFIAPTSHVWVQRAGSFLAFSGGLVGQAATNLATVNGSNVIGDVTEQADIALAANQSAGLVTRYDAATNSMYLATLQNNGNGTFTASIELIQNGVVKKQFSAAAASGTGTLIFTLKGSTLQMFLGKTQLLSATDATLSSGEVGIQIGKGVAIGNFQ